MNTPTFSVIVPTFNRPEQLRACLQALLRLEYPVERFEILIVNDGGDEVAQPSGPREFCIRMLYQANAGPAAARNLGAANASGEILAFTDDDCLPHPDWLQALARVHSSVTGAGIGGRTINAFATNACSVASQAVQEVMHRRLNQESGRCVFFPSNNVSFPRKDFLEMQGFDEKFRTAEDRDLCDRWIQSGRILAYADDAVVEHAHHLVIRSLFAQHFNYGKGAFRYYHARKLRGQEGLRIDGDFYRSLLIHPFYCGHGLRLRLFGSILVTQFATVAGYAWQGLGL